MTIPTATSDRKDTARSPRSGSEGLPRKKAVLIPGGLRWILPGMIISVGLIYYAIVYSGFISFFDWGGGRSP